MTKIPDKNKTWFNLDVSERGNDWRIWKRLRYFKMSKKELPKSPAAYSWRKCTQFRVGRCENWARCTISIKTHTVRPNRALGSTQWTNTFELRILEYSIKIVKNANLPNLLACRKKFPPSRHQFLDATILKLSSKNWHMLGGNFFLCARKFC